MNHDNPPAARISLVATLLLATLATLLGPLVPAHAATAGCRHIAGPFHTSHSAVYNSAGQRYVPYGINVIGLAHPLLMRADYASTVSSDEAVIQAAATYWCANTVRLQVEQDYLVSSSGTIDQSFLSAVESEVSYARQLGLLVALNDQTQTGPDASSEFMPTHRTMAFWSSLAYHYRSDPGVIFDLFNEPHEAGSWAFWRNGGMRSGTRYYGMENVAKLIRQKGARNLLWVEGPHTGGTLRYAWQNRLRHVYPLMYAEHRPPGPHTPASWYGAFGYLAARNLAPVLDGEWADYARTDAPWACWDDAPTSVPAWLRYFAKLHMGMIVTKMVQGQLIESPSLDDPTHIKSNWACTSGLDQGAGNQIRNWFSLHNS